MQYLVRFYQGKPHVIAHLVHRVDGIEGALCSHIPNPAAGEQSRNGRWDLTELLPPDVRICHVCQKLKRKLDNPLPARVEAELEKLALWDVRAADLQRQKMLAHYRQQQLQKAKKV
jgi:hypothetical protein